MTSKKGNHQKQNYVEKIKGSVSYQIVFGGLLKGVGTRLKQRWSWRPGRQPDGAFLLQSGALAHVKQVSQVRVIDLRRVGHDFRRQEAGRSN